VKEKIWANDYVNMAKLLNIRSNSSPKTKSYTINANSSTGDDALTFSFGAPKRKITSFPQWQSAFAIFSSVYLDKFPTLSKQLIVYEAAIQDLMERGGGVTGFFMTKVSVITWPSTLVVGMNPSGNCG
jgi:hypothetical protein